MFKDEKGKILYVGKAKNLKKRVGSYFSSKALDAKTIKLVSALKDIEIIKVSSEIEAFLLESELIKKNKPFFNVKLTDDKSYPMVEITKNENPAVVITRKKVDKKAVYFGPYTDVKSLKVVLKLLRKVFPYQSVKNHPKRKCLYYHLNLCPCIPVVPENLPEYKKSIQAIERFLKGKKKDVLKSLQKERDIYSKNEDFEMAAKIQEKIEKINYITSETFEPFHYIEKPDFYYERIEKELKSLKDIIEPFFPNLVKLNRIECYDISNISGTNPTGSMVVFINGEKASNEYRRFKIKTKYTPDDFHMMQEMILRRFKNVNWEKPDLMIVDGGKGQVSSALKAMTAQKVKYPLIGLAKREEIIVIPVKTSGKLEFVEVKLPQSTPGINFLKKVRDEAHRFALTYHRLLRKKSLLANN